MKWHSWWQTIRPISPFWPYLFFNKPTRYARCSTSTLSCKQPSSKWRLSFTTLNLMGKRFHDGVGREGCLLVNLNSQGTQEVSLVHLQWPPLQIQVPTIWAVDSATDIYRIPETCDHFIETTRAMSDYIPWGSAVVASRSKGTRKIVSQSESTANQPGIPIPSWLGCSLSKKEDRESLEHKSTKSSYQCPRIESSTSSYPKTRHMSTFRKASPLADGQHDRCVVYQQTGRDQVQSTYTAGFGYLGTMPVSQHNAGCPIPSRY